MDKILIIDDDKDMQSVLSDIIESEGYTAFAAGDGKKALKVIKTHSPHLILLDMRLPGMNGMKVLEEIKKMDKDSMVIVLTGYGDIKGAVQAMKLGAFDYITKPFENEEMVANIKHALKIIHLNTESQPATLSLREKEILKWLKKGKTSWDISIILCISERTVNFHVKNIMQKLNAVSRIQAVAVAVEKGL
jgi:FixJ family two-component response regulator